MTKIRWTPKAYLTCNDSTCQFPSVKPKATTIYKVVVTDANGCTATDDVAIFVNKVRRVYIPSAFSPGNSDGYNDLLRVFLGDETLKVKWFKVFDRWGNMVYEDVDFSKAESQNINRGWNGVFKGEALDPAVFTYHVQVEFTDGEVKDYKGDVMLVRY
jgi:gliding motility-associated-like protein